MDVTYREYQPKDFAAWVQMRSLLWPEIEPEDAEADAREWLARTDGTVLVAQREAGADLCGFAELGERAYADGCDTAPVAYLEGWYVRPEVRGQGVGAGLVAAGLVWARERGFREMASDALLENADSQRAHEAVGFSEVERVVLYRRAV